MFYTFTEMYLHYRNVHLYRMTHQHQQNKILKTYTDTLYSLDWEILKCPMMYANFSVIEFFKRYVTRKVFEQLSIIHLIFLVILIDVRKNCIYL